MAKVVEGFVLEPELVQETETMLEDHQAMELEHQEQARGLRIEHQGLAML